MFSKNEAPLPQIQIRPLATSDVEEVIILQDENNLSNWSVSDYLNQINNPCTISLLATFNQKAVGFLISRLIINNDSAHIILSENGEFNVGNELEIYNIAVREKFQNSGIGTALLKALVEESRFKSVGVIWLEVRETNDKAIKFYRTQGFVQVYKRKNYYSNPADDALVMKMELNDK